MDFLEYLGQRLMLVWSSVIGAAGLIVWAIAATGPHQWGDVPTWVATVGTLGSFAVGLAIYHSSVQDRRNAPARSVATYLSATRDIARSKDMEVWDGTGFTQARANLPGRVKQLVVALENCSNDPIHKIRIDLGLPEGPTIRRVAHGLEYLRPQGRVRTNFFFELSTDTTRIRPRVRFTDALGKDWIVEPGLAIRRARSNDSEYSDELRPPMILTSELVGVEGN